jgi:hypothetical protein
MILNNLRDKLSKIPLAYLSYGILKPCYRCSYQKSNEPILIFSKSRGPRIVIFPKIATLVRFGDCIGFETCGRCFEQSKMNSTKFPCKWSVI